MKVIYQISVSYYCVHVHILHFPVYFKQSLINNTNKRWCAKDFCCHWKRVSGSWRSTIGKTRFGFFLLALQLFLL
jgi:hypothetical protein